MLNLASAAKALKAISEDGEALRCVEHAPAEERRAVLKDIRKLAGPICMSFMMGELEWPRKRQGVIMDAVMASRITLVASNAETKFVMTEQEEGDEADATASAALSQRAADDLAELKTTQGLLAARRNALSMLRTYGLDVRDDEDLGRTRFELTVLASGGAQAQPVSGHNRAESVLRPGLEIGPRMAATPRAPSSLKRSARSVPGAPGARDTGSRGQLPRSERGHEASQSRAEPLNRSLSEETLKKVMSELAGIEKQIALVVGRIKENDRRLDLERGKYNRAQEERAKMAAVRANAVKMSTTQGKKNRFATIWPFST